MANFCKYSEQIKNHFIRDGGVGDLEAVLKKAGASDLEAKDVNRIISTRFKQASSKDLDKLMERLLKDPEIKKKSKNFTSLVKGTFEGEISPTQLKNSISENLNIPTLNPKKAKRIESLAKEIKELKTNEGLNLNKIREKVAYLEREIEEAVPAKLSRKAETYTVANLLLNPKTIERNILSNEFEALGQSITNIVRGRYKVSDVKLLNDLRFRSLKQISSDIKKGIRTTGLGKDEIYGAGFARAFRPEDAEGIAKAFEKLGEVQEKGLRYALEAHDVVVRDLSYAQSVLGQLRKQKALKNYNLDFKSPDELDSFLKKLENGEIKEMTPERWKDIKFVGEWESAHTVLQDDSAIANLASKLGRLVPDDAFYAPVWNALIGTVMKFRKTPANVVVRMIEKDLIGGPTVTALRYLTGKKKGLTPYVLREQALKTLTSWLTSSLGFGGAGYVLSAMGFIAPEGYKDAQVMKIGDTTINIAPFALFAPALGLGANIEQNLSEAKKEGKNQVKAILDAYGDNVTDLTKAFLDMPFISGTKKGLETLEALGDPELAKEKFSEFIVNGGTQWVPMASLLRGIAKGMDPAERETYDKDFFKKSLNYAISGVPGLRQTLNKKIDTAGMEVKPVFGNSFQRTLDAVFNPALVKRSPEADPVFKELRSLARKDVRKKAKFDYAPNKIRYKDKSYELTSEEKRKFQKLYGGRTYNTIKILLQNPAYNKMNADKKEEIIHKIELESKKFARVSVLRDKLSNPIEKKETLNDTIKRILGG